MGARNTLPYVSKNAFIREENIPKGFGDALKIPEDQYLCPLCERIPEILSVHTDNGHIELKCKYHDIIDITIEDYFTKMKDSQSNYYNLKCFNCGYSQDNKNSMLNYCCYCKDYLCETCINLFDLKNKEHKRDHLEVCIPVNEKYNKCLDHIKSDIKNFCFDCEENVCDKELTERHKGHNKIELTKMEAELNKYKEIIVQKNKTLSNIIRFNQLILNTYNTFQYNYFHIQSIINIGKSFEEENKRDAKEIELMINNLPKIHKAYKEARKKLQHNLSIDLNVYENKLSLRKRNLGDIGMELISKIPFKWLKEIDFSGNNIQNIGPLNNMILPNLEYINLSENLLQDIKPLTELNSKKLKEICLQTNNIQDFRPFLDSEFPNIKRIRIEKNPFNEDLPEFKKFLQKYKKKVVYKAKTIEDFKREYSNCNINEKMDIIDLSGLRAGDKLLEDLYLALNPDIKIRSLNLHNNDLKDVSILKRFYLKRIEMLDLSLNEITNVKFLREFKSKKLRIIYLNDNHLKDITPLIKIFDEGLCENDKIEDEQEDDEENDVNNFDKKINFPELETISLKQNFLKQSDFTKNQLELFNTRSIATDIPK